MTAYAYAALDQKGKEQKGIVEGDNARQVRQSLRDQGLAPLKIEEAVSNKAKSAATSDGASHYFGGPKLKISELAMITRQLATLLQSSMPLEESLNTVSKQSENNRVQSIIMAVRSKVLEGHSLDYSLAEFPRAFPALYRATVAAGEHSGHLDLVLNRLADYTENAYTARQKAKLALLYPVILFVLAILIVTGLMTFVVPDVVEVFVGQGQQLPALTTALIGLSDFILDYGIVLLVLLSAAFISLRYSLSNKDIRLKFDKFLLSVPLVRRFIKGADTSRYASTLSILTNSGVPLVDAMAIASEVMSNSWLRQGVIEAAQQVSEGASLHQALDRVGYFPPMMIHMIASGEASGELDDMMDRVAVMQQRQLDNLVATLIGVFEPAMLLFMGATVLLIVVAILQPIFDLNQLI